MAMKMVQKLNHYLKLFTISYVCISVSGCFTPAAFNDARMYSNRESKYWIIENVTFAAISEQRYIRLCINLQRFGENILTETIIDLQQLDVQLQEESDPIASMHNQQKLETIKSDKRSSTEDASARSGYSDDNSPPGHLAESIEYTSCNTALKENETLLKIEKRHVGDDDLPTFLKDIRHTTNDAPTLFLLEKNGKNYLAFGALEDTFPNLTGQSIRCYGEDQRENLRYLFIPFVLAFDIGIMIVGAIRLILCIIIFPCIIAEASSSSYKNYKPPKTLFPPKRTAQPAECR